MILIADYGVVNLASIANMLKRIGAAVIVSSGLPELIRPNKLKQ